VTITVAQTIPRPPTIAAISPSGSGGAYVYFTVPNSGSPVLDDTATCTSSGHATKTLTGPVSPLHLTGMVNGALYYCVVHARNQHGTGDDSASDLVRVGTPSAPQAVSEAKGTSSGQIKVTWGNANQNASAITGWVVACSPTPSAAGGQVANVAASVRSHTFGGLNRSLTFTCKAAAKNSFGNGKFRIAPTTTKPR
jgi:hypothetical protein